MVLERITRYVQSHGSWWPYVEEAPADKIPSVAEWSGEGLIVCTDDGQIAKAIPQFRGTNAVAEAVKIDPQTTQYMQDVARSEYLAAQKRLAEAMKR